MAVMRVVSRVTQQQELSNWPDHLTHKTHKNTQACPGYQPILPLYKQRATDWHKGRTKVAMIDLARKERDGHLTEVTRRHAIVPIVPYVRVQFQYRSSRTCSVARNGTFKATSTFLARESLHFALHSKNDGEYQNVAVFPVHLGRKNEM